MQLCGADGYGVDMRVVGYQFPDAEDPMKRRGWHLVEGTATCAEGSWSRRYPALTCDESPLLSAWLREAADAPHARPLGAAVPRPTLTFLEPNLEFAPPWRARRAAGSPHRVRCQVDRERLLLAAERWDAEIAPYPDL